MAESTVQHWSLTVEGREHRVESSGSIRHRVRWFVDDELVGERVAAEERFTLEPEDPEHRDEVGRLKILFGGMGHGRRATLAPPEGSGRLEIDLEPEPGSRAAAYEAKVREHPRRYAALEAGIGVGKVVGGILLTILLANLAFRVALPSIDLPSIPRPNLPDLPSIPWPDLPSIPTPNLPDISLPGWLSWLLDQAKYVVPVLVAIGLALAEIRRRREQDERRRQQREGTRDERSE